MSNEETIIPAPHITMSVFVVLAEATVSLKETNLPQLKTRLPYCEGECLTELSFLLLIGTM